jgi:hypothetical protein
VAAWATTVAQGTEIYKYLFATYPNHKPMLLPGSLQQLRKARPY